MIIPAVDDEVRVLTAVRVGRQLIAGAGSQGIVTARHPAGAAVRFPNGATGVVPYSTLELIGHNAGGIMVETQRPEGVGAELKPRTTFVHNPSSNIVHVAVRIGPGPRLTAEGCNLDDATDAYEYSSLNELSRKVESPDDVELCAICVLPSIE